MNVFDKIASLRATIPEAEQMQMVADIIDVMKAHNLTYDQSHKIIDLTTYALRDMSAALSL